MGMNDKYKKQWIAKARLTIQQQQQIIDGYSKQITELKRQNQELKRLLDEARHQISTASAISLARLDEMECEAYNL